MDGNESETHGFPLRLGLLVDSSARLWPLFGGMGFIVLSLYLAWRSGPYFGIEWWHATGLVLVEYVVVALASGPSRRSTTARSAGARRKPRRGLNGDQYRLAPNHARFTPSL